MLASLLILSAQAAAAPEAGEPENTIVVTAVPSESRVLPPATGLDEEALVERQPATVADALRGLPGVLAQTNSRGETIARIRGAEERQTQIFLDGAPIAVPWDGRADLGVIPAGVLQEIRIVKGAAPVEYGTNAVAGVVDLRTRSRVDGFSGAVRIGTQELLDGSLTGGVRTGGFSLVGAAAGLTRDADSSDGLSAIYGRDGRTNTDLDSGSFLLSAGYSGGPFTGRALLFHNRSERGIAPETAADPSLVNQRFWRYPEIETTQLILSSELDVGPQATLRFLGWRQWFGQTIDQYEDASYSTRSARQTDDDDTLGGRLTFTAPLEPLTVRISGTAQTSRHVQVDADFPIDGAAAELRYRQNLFSLGAEADVPLGLAEATFGIAYDRAETPLTGNKPARAPLDALAFSAAVRTPLSPGLTLSLSGGRRTRFPTPRELFGEALGRFLLNPDLRPERAWLADAELSLTRGGLELSVNPFLVRSDDTLSQRVVEVDGQFLRQRFNLPGSWSYGIDASLSAAVSPELRVELYGSALRARADESEEDVPRQLIQRPSYEFGGALDYESARGLSARVQLRSVGPGIDIARDGDVVRLDSGTHLDLRATQRIAGIGGRDLSITAAADNVLGGTITPQLGLPLPGRSFRIGLRVD